MRYGPECTKCGGARDGAHHSYCKACKAAHEYARSKGTLVPANPANSATHKKCPDCGDVKSRNPEFGKSGRASYCKACTKVRNAAAGNRNSPYDSERRRAVNLRVMGLTAAQYDEMLERQGGGCAVCGGVNESGRRLIVDHDHSCCGPKKACLGCVRGLLCSKCNIGIGHLRDDPVLLLRAADYLMLPRLVEVT